MDETQPVPPDLQPDPPQPEPEQGEKPRKGALVRATFYGDNAPTLEHLEQIVERALRAEGFDVNANRAEWT